MQRSIYLSLIFSLSTYFVFGQNYSEVLRYSQLNPGGTARVMGVGGSFGAMGGDYGGVTINPSALGNYWISEFTISPSFTLINSDAQLNNGSANNEFDAKVNLDNLGVVFASSPWAEAWESTSWTLGYNKLANYNETFAFQGSTNGSIITRYLELANGNDPSQLDNYEAGLAYDVGAIFDPDGFNIYDADFDTRNTVVNKGQTIERSGGMSEFVIGWGANYKRKLNIGATFGIPIVRFEESKLYEEDDDNNEIPVFNRHTFSEFTKTEGAGVKFSLGATYKVNQNIRVGLAYHSSSILFLQDSFETVSFYDYTFNGINESFDSRSPQGVFDYSVKTPNRMIGSFGYIFRKNKVAGFLNADVELINYANSSFNLTRSSQSTQADADYETILNNLIETELANALNIRLGGELASGKFRFRAGLGLNQSPFKSDGKSFENVYSAGFGIKGEKFYIDFGTRLIQNQFGYIPYLLDDPGQEQVVQVDLTKLEFLITGGVSF